MTTIQLSPLYGDMLSHTLTFLDRSGNFYAVSREWCKTLTIPREKYLRNCENFYILKSVLNIPEPVGAIATIKSCANAIFFKDSISDQVRNHLNIQRKITRLVDHIFSKAGYFAGYVTNFTRKDAVQLIETSFKLLGKKKKTYIPSGYETILYSQIRKDSFFESDTLIQVAKLIEAPGCVDFFEKLSTQLATFPEELQSELKELPLTHQNKPPHEKVSLYREWFQKNRAAFSKMTSLDLNDLRLEFLPEEVESLPSLKDLKLKNNSFLDLPWDVIKRLETFDYSENTIAGERFWNETWGTIYNDLTAFNTRTFAIYDFVISCLTVLLELILFFSYSCVKTCKQIGEELLRFGESHHFPSLIREIVRIIVKNVAIAVPVCLFFLFSILFKLSSSISNSTISKLKSRGIFFLKNFENLGFEGLGTLKINWLFERYKLLACNQLAIQTFKLMSSV